MKTIQTGMIEMIIRTGESIRTISKRSNIPEATIRNIIHGRVFDPRLSTFIAICHACGTTVAEFFASLQDEPEVYVLPEVMEEPPTLFEEPIPPRPIEEEIDEALRAAQECIVRALVAREAMKGGL